MITIGSNGQKIAYGIKHYNIDTESDLQKIHVNSEVMGCTCFVIETSKYYMLNGQKKWIEITPFGKTISGGGEDDPGIPDDPSNDIIYEGGII